MDSESDKKSVILPPPAGRGPLVGNVMLPPPAGRGFVEEKQEIVKLDQKSPTFSTLIKSQSSGGYWPSIEPLLDYFREDVTPGKDETVWATILALYVL